MDVMRNGILLFSITDRVWKESEISVGVCADRGSKYLANNRGSSYEKRLRLAVSAPLLTFMLHIWMILCSGSHHIWRITFRNMYGIIFWKLDVVLVQFY